jgi:hypothetical protein
VTELHYVAFDLPKLDVVAVNEALGVLLAVSSSGQRNPTDLMM